MDPTALPSMPMDRNILPLPWSRPIERLSRVYVYITEGPERHHFANNEANPGQTTLENLLSISHIYNFALEQPHTLAQLEAAGVQLPWDVHKIILTVDASDRKKIEKHISGPTHFREAFRACGFFSAVDLVDIAAYDADLGPDGENPGDHRTYQLNSTVRARMFDLTDNESRVYPWIFSDMDLPATVMILGGSMDFMPRVEINLAEPRERGGPRIRESHVVAHEARCACMSLIYLPDVPGFVPPVPEFNPSLRGPILPGPSSNPTGSAFTLPGLGLNPVGSGLNPSGTGFALPSLNLNPAASGLNPPGTGFTLPSLALNPPASGLNPPGSGLNLPGLEFNPPGPSLNPPGPSNPLGPGLDPPGSRSNPPASRSNPRGPRSNPRGPRANSRGPRSKSRGARSNPPSK